MPIKRDKSKPQVFELPDGDKVALITWDYVMKQLDEQLSPMIDSLNAIHKDLTRIDTKLADLTKDM